MVTEIVERMDNNWVEVRKTTLPPNDAEPRWEHQWEIYFVWYLDDKPRADSYLGEFIFWTETEIPKHGDTIQANEKIAECIEQAKTL